MSLVAGVPQLARTAEDMHDATAARGGVWRVFNDACDGLYRFILVRVGGDRSAADDLLQQMCCVAAGHRRPPDGSEACEAWLRGIARNLVRKHWREARRRGRHLPVEDAAISSRLAEDLEARPLPPEMMARRELREQLLLAVTALPAADQTLIFAFYFEGRSQVQIAAETNVSVKSLEARLYRARNRLRAALRDFGRTDS